MGVTVKEGVRQGALLLSILAFLTLSLELPLQGQRRFLGELVICSSADRGKEGYPGSLRYLFHALHYGPVLRKMLNEVMEGGVERVGGMFDIDLTDCPIVQHPRADSLNDPIVVAVNAEDWVQQGCLHATCGQWYQVGSKKLLLDLAEKLTERMGMERWWVMRQWGEREEDQYDRPRVEVERSNEYQGRLETANNELGQLVKRMKMKQVDRGAGGDRRAGGGGRELVNLVVKSSDGREVWFKVKHTTKFSQVMRAYGNKVGVDMGSVRCLFNGQSLKLEQTPADLDMKDEDEIDVVVQRPPPSKMRKAAEENQRRKRR
jgi:hypothetical protein